MTTRHEQRTDTVVVGGGQAGLAMSYLLTQMGRGHVVLEKADRIASSWRRRWDSFTLVTPNWQLQLPGHPYQGDDPDGFLPRDQAVRYLEDYAASFDPPIRLGVTVTSVDEGQDGGYRVQTTDGCYLAANVVVAAGTFQRPRIPEPARGIPEGITQLHSSEYRNPDQLPDGPVLVVGSGQSGCQIARELWEAGRDVHLCVGSARRMPRRYRGRDSTWWATRLGLMDQTVDQLDSPAERFAPNPQASGRNGGEGINLHRFARDGIHLLGHLEDVVDGKAILAPDLHQRLADADALAAELRAGVDEFVAAAGLDAPEEEVDEPRDGFEVEVATELDLSRAGISTVLWATGYRWDYSWVHPAEFDEYGYPIQRQGATDRPGLYFVGLHWLHKLKSGLFLGVGEDAAHVAEHIAARS